jgi:hypothetical protein
MPEETKETSCDYCLSDAQHPWGEHPRSCICLGCETSPILGESGYQGGHPVTCFCVQCFVPLDL